MNEISQPLTPADCNLQDFPFMPLDVKRLRDSDLAALTSGDEFRCAVLLWCASWHQTPAGSLPDDDIVLASLAGFGRVVREWLKVKKGSMRGWIKCADGRLYHQVVADAVNNAWTSKLKQRLKTECARIKKHNERHGTRLPFPEFDEWLAAGCPAGHALPVPSDKPNLSPGQRPHVAGSVPSETPSKREGEGEREYIKPLGHRATTQPELARGVEGSETSSSEGGKPEVTPTAAALLSQAMRKHGVMSNPGDPRLIALGNQGVTVETVEAACEEAKLAKPGERIGPAYVAAIIERWSKEAKAIDATGAKPPEQRAGNPPKEVDRWWTSESGIQRRAKELGIRILPSHKWDDVKAMCFEKERKLKDQAKNREGAAA